MILMVIMAISVLNRSRCLFARLYQSENSDKGDGGDDGDDCLEYEQMSVSKA